MAMPLYFPFTLDRKKWAWYVKQQHLISVANDFSVGVIVLIGGDNSYKIAKIVGTGHQSNYQFIYTPSPVYTHERVVVTQYTKR